MKRLGLLLLSLSFAAAALFAGTVKGIVTDAKSGNPLVGANVYMDGTTYGAATDMDGAYMIEVPDGKYNVVCSYIGYKDEERLVKVDGDVQVDFEMKEFSFSQSIVVIADRAKELETPVAFTDIKQAEMEVKLGSRDIPLILNTTPSVYATGQGGGAGDARINVRGFNQRNVAIMINGVPVNDMENGWVYWSNWDGIGDATASIQVQRGLSAVNLATPSIGGTMNIITAPSQQNAGFKFKQELGNNYFIKTSLFGNTGLIDGKYAISAGIVKKTGDGLIYKTFTDAWAYYFAAEYNINKQHRLEFYATGAPQRHGQSLYRQNIAAYDSTFAKSLDGFDRGAIDNKFTQSFQGREYNENVWAVDPRNKSDQYWKMYFQGGSATERYGETWLNERENYFHKPIVNLNYYGSFGDDLNLYSVLYWSGGQGGGSGTLGHMEWDYASQPTRVVDWNATYANNRDHGDSQGILRNSVNNQWTIGALVKAYWKPLETTTFSFGLDWRTAEIDHYREIRDLLGGQYYDLALTPWYGSTLYYGSQTQIGLGDKIAYYNTNNVDWYGGYAQGEYTLDALTAYGTVGISTIKYKFTDHWNADPNDPTAEHVIDADAIPGYQIKGGASYRLTNSFMVYGNLGYVSKVPIFDQVIDDNDGVLNNNPENEKFTSIEAGADWRGMDGQLTLKGNFYYTLWTDRSYTRFVNTEDGEGAIVSLSGVNQLHTGLELEGAYQPMRMFRIDMAASFGNWKHTDDATGSYKDYNSGTIEYQYSIKDLYVGDAPQTQIAFGATVFPIDGLQATLQYRYYARFYADWDPDSREFDPTDPTKKGDYAQSWLTPSYGVMDFHLNYVLPFDFNGTEFVVFAHAFNLLDTKYIQDATDNSRFNSYHGVNDGNGHLPHNAEVFMGLPFSWNVGFTVNY